MSDTPRTDAAFDGDISVNLQPEIKNWEDAKHFAKRLEVKLTAALAERDAARECLREAIKEVETEPIWSSLIRDTLNRWRDAAGLEGK